jgi:hypothetical protein
VVASCAAPTTSGKAVKATDADTAVVALMDTGTYATVPGRPFGVAGDNVGSQHLMEAHRIAEYTVGPWAIEAALVALPGTFESALISPITSVKMLRDGNIVPLPDIAEAHGFMSGFTTVRMAPQEEEKFRGLQNVVLRFPDPQSAAAAAGEMLTKAPPLREIQPWPAEPLPNAPESLAVTYDLPDSIRRVDSFTAHGVFVLYQSARVDLRYFQTAHLMVSTALNDQKKRIDEFTPTEPAALPSLPMDPTGQLMARTLWAPDNAGPVMMGVWAPQAWLHFEQDPIATGALFNTTGVDAVTQRLTTVYQAGNADGSARIVDEFARQIGGLEDVKPIDGVPGLPSAQCFERTKDWVPEAQAMTYQRVGWHFKCVASAERWAYTAFSQHAADARQQMAAQYRILTGE